MKERKVRKEEERKKQETSMKLEAKRIRTGTRQLATYHILGFEELDEVTIGHAEVSLPPIFLLIGLHPQEAKN